MTDAFHDPFSELITQYKETVETLHVGLANTSQPIEQIEQVFLETITLREKIDLQLRDDDSLRTATPAFAQIAQIDERLYLAVQDLRMRPAFNPAKWQYILPNSTEAGWWWRLDQVPRWTDNEITYEQGFSPALIPAVIFILIALGLAAFSAQQLWANGQQLIGNISLIGQVLVGAGLISPRGRDIAARILTQLLSWFDDRLSFTADTTHSQFPLTRRRLRISFGILGVSIIFLAFVIFVTTVGIPATARWLHAQGVQAVEERNASRAEFYLEFAVSIQPDLSLIPFEFSGAPSLAQLGNLHRDLGNIEDAKAAYQNALTEDARMVNVHYRLAELYLMEGEIERAFTVLDQAIILLEQHIAGEVSLPLGTDEEDGMNEAVQLLYLTYVTRADTFLNIENGDLAALNDLDSAELITTTNPDLFITVDTIAETIPGRILTTKLRVLRGRAWVQVLEDQCAEQALAEWGDVVRLSRFAVTSTEQLWLNEANTNREQCEQT